MAAEVQDVKSKMSTNKTGGEQNEDITGRAQ